VLDWDEASAHPQARARNNTIEIDGIRQPAPAPKFSACPAGVPDPPSRELGTLDAAIDEWSTVRAT
jgi:alpha-methylacyl-CoA racemase